MQEENKPEKELLGRQEQDLLSLQSAAVPQYWPLQMASDAKIKKRLPGKGQIEACV